jgi:hypothetical protein
MKRWLYSIILTIILSFNGVGETQVKSQFPKLNKQDIASVEFELCPDGNLFAIIGYEKDNDVIFYSYEINDVIFAVIEFTKSSDKAIAIYVLRRNKTVVKFVPEEFKKIEIPCNILKFLGLRSNSTF